MPIKIAKQKAESDVAEKLFARAYQNMHAKIAVRFNDKESYKKWSKQAREKRDQCKQGIISPEDYSAWLCASGVGQDYIKEGIISADRQTVK